MMMTTNPEDIATEDLAIAKSSVAISPFLRTPVSSSSSGVNIHQEWAYCPCLGGIGEMWACCRRRGEWLLDATGSPPHLSCTQTTHTDGAAKISHLFSHQKLGPIVELVCWECFWFTPTSISGFVLKILFKVNPTQLMWVVGDWRTMIPTFESWWIWKCPKSSQQCDFSAVLTRAQDNWQVLHSPIKTLISSSVWHFNSINATRGNSCSKQTTVINKQPRRSFKNDLIMNVDHELRLFLWNSSLDDIWSESGRSEVFPNKFCLIKKNVFPKLCSLLDAMRW